MRAILLSISDAELRERRARGLDYWDEMWEGVLHMVPLPSFDHQSMSLELSRFLADMCDRLHHGRLCQAVGVHDPDAPDQNYRGPDISFVASGHQDVIRKRGIVGPPDSLIELRSPEDETYEKFPFFARLGVPEVVVIDVESRRPEVYRLAGRTYRAVAPGKDGSIAARVLGIRLRLLARPRRLRVEALDRPEEAVEL